MTARNSAPRGTASSLDGAGRLAVTLTRLYPRNWRRRYGAELSALLEDLGPHTRGVRRDLIRGAIDAQLHRPRYPMLASATPPRWPAWSLLAGVAAVGGLVVLALLRYPGNLHDPGTPIYLAAFCTMFALFVGLAGWAARRPRSGAAFGTVVGLVAAASWSVEVWAGGPAKLDRPVEIAVGGSVELLAVAVTVSAGVLSGLRRRDKGAAMRAGLFAGLVSGVVLFCFAVVMTLTNLGVLATRDDYRSQFATGHSHAPDIATFLVGDILAAGIAHLLINLLLGLIGGGLGAVAASALGRSTRVPASAVAPSRPS
jgi:hypothetical protein